MHLQSSNATRGRASTSHGHHEGIGSRTDGGASDRAGAAGPTDPSVSANVPYHIAQLLASAVSSSFDQSRQQQLLSGLYNDPSSQHAQQAPPSVNPSVVAAASSLGASLAQLLGANPYLAPQLALPNLLSMGALGLNPAGGAGLPGFPGGVFGAPTAPQNIHPLYNTPLLASLFQPQTQQNPSQSQLPSALFQGLAYPQNQTQSDDNRDSKQQVDRTIVPQSSSHRPSHSTGDTSALSSSRDDGGGARSTPEPASVDYGQGANLGQASTFINFLNAITAIGGPQQSPLPNQAAPAAMSNQNMNAATFGNHGLSNNIGIGTSAGATGQNLFSNLGLFGGLGVGSSLPSTSGPPGDGIGATPGRPPGAFGMGGNSGGGLDSSSLGQQEQRISMQGPSRKRTRDGTSAFSDINEMGFPLSAAVDNLPPSRGLERYANESEDGTGMGTRLRGAVGLDDDESSDALQLDMGRASSGYEEGIAGVRAGKRGRTT